MGYPKFFPPKIMKGAFGGPVGGFSIALAAWRRGLEVVIHKASYTSYEVRGKDNVVTFFYTRSIENTGGSIANSKERTKSVLSAAGVNTPKGFTFNYTKGDIGRIINIANEFNYPLVIKPIYGSMGKGVIANIENSDSLKEKLLYCNEGYKYLIEEHFQGIDLRVYVVGAKVIAAVHRVPANIVGDGVSTVNELIEAKNIEKRKNPFLYKGQIVIDDEVLYFLSKKKYDLESVPSNDEICFLRAKANASAGGDTIDVTDKISDKVKSEAVKALLSVDSLDHAGVDVIWDEESDNCCVIEINSTPQIGVNMYPMIGVGRDIANGIIDYYFPNTSVIRGANRVFFSNYEVRKSLSARGISCLIPPMSSSPRISRRFITTSLPSLDPVFVKKLLKYCKDMCVFGRVSHREDGTLDVVLNGTKSNLDKVVEMFNKQGGEVGSLEKYRGYIRNHFFIKP